VFLAAVEAGLVELAVIGVLTSVVGAFYYIRIVKVMFFDDPAPAFEGGHGRGVGIVVAVTAIVNSPVSYFVLIAPLVTAAGWAAKSLPF